MNQAAVNEIIPVIIGHNKSASKSILLADEVTHAFILANNATVKVPRATAMEAFTAANLGE